MKRFHVNMTVKDLEKSVAFYTALFGTGPTLKKHDYARWMLEDPRVNFALSTHGLKPGIDHVGIQAESEEELAEIRACLDRAEGPIFEQPEVECCYSKSAKAWIRDPNGIAWETFVTIGATTNYGDGSPETAARIAGPIDTDVANEAACCSSPALSPSGEKCC